MSEFIFTYSVTIDTPFVIYQTVFNSDTLVVYLGERSNCFIRQLPSKPSPAGQGSSAQKYITRIGFCYIIGYSWCMDVLTFPEMEAA